MTGMKKDTETLVGWKVTGRAMVGLDLADRSASWCAMDATGELRRGALSLTRESVGDLFLGAPPCRVVMEAGTQTRWVAKEVQRAGHEALVVPATVLVRPKRRRKNDAIDARLHVDAFGFRADRERFENCASGHIDNARLGSIFVRHEDAGAIVAHGDDLWVGTAWQDLDQLELTKIDDTDTVGGAVRRW